MSDEGILIILSGPSGSGKGTIVKKLKQKDNFAVSISVTTREPRPGEKHGIDYLFCNREEFIKIRDQGGFLEHAQFCGNLYGTPKFYIDEQIKKKKFVILEIDVNGALQVKDKVSNCILVFIVPPTIDELKKRLIGRNTETPQKIIDRLDRAKEELKLIYDYDYIVVNDDIDMAIKKIEKIVEAESLRPARNSLMIKKIIGGD